MSQPYIVPPCHEEVEILFEDDFLLLINKPSGLLSVPGRLPQNKDCMITRIQRDYPTATVAHRLDLDTSGLMMVPLCRDVHADLTRQFQAKAISKSYTALLWGDIAEDGSIDLPIACDWERRPRQKICAQQGKPSLTHYQVLERHGDRTRVLLKPVTGRSHQLRIHSREIGHPILGCDLYAHDEALAAAPRLMLHATTLKFTHPLSGEVFDWHCPPPF
ncbi:tRNA pseudouridine32 synthase/23S rRNA pseudouridine746 synthase [Sinobacterium caligoides]|uniref:tRNA pseudouridine32 synthase/23S rRNA pseudouridine746 synthase n=1 Tax=Sinobacterium caligoides TaxID=933926 RepID=A0A3N2E2E0_9GAMM|nr:pseudouridine synthase [Sinobacterium caligoides]ROS05745.1 tRNA pseudouridine32 synthase/23S rRNA pseudouridine746 synthase [Sinobacterium caligoides]